jgi:hypothetical protein
MNALILTEEERQTLEELNASGDSTRQLRPAELREGGFALNADLLEDSGPDQTWEHYGEFLRLLPMTELEPAEFEAEQLS